jgi:hypothetical protein
MNNNSFMKCCQCRIFLFDIKKSNCNTLNLRYLKYFAVLNKIKYKMVFHKLRKQSER